MFGNSQWSWFWHRAEASIGGLLELLCDEASGDEGYEEEVSDESYGILSLDGIV